MILAYYAAPIVTFMRRILFFIVHPIAKGLDSLLGVHNHQRIQHKDFATYLTGNVLFNIKVENFETDIEDDSYINFIASMPKSSIKNDSIKETLHD